MITFEENRDGQAMKLVTWDQVNFLDEEKEDHPIRKISIELTVGGVAEIIVERYAGAKDKEGYSIRTLDKNGEDSPLTYKERWAFGNNGEDITIPVRKDMVKQNK